MSIFVGIGGWVYPDWRDNFYPKGLSQKRELEYASSKLTGIEVNGTYYGSQKPESFGMLAHRENEIRPATPIFKGCAKPTLSQLQA